MNFDPANLPKFLEVWMYIRATPEGFLYASFSETPSSILGENGKAYKVRIPIPESAFDFPEPETVEGAEIVQGPEKHNLCREERE